jgi:hypothetical protein
VPEPLTDAEVEAGVTLKKKYGKGGAGKPTRPKKAPPKSAAAKRAASPAAPAPVPVDLAKFRTGAVKTAEGFLTDLERKIDEHFEGDHRYAGPKAYQGEQWERYVGEAMPLLIRQLCDLHAEGPYHLDGPQWDLFHAGCIRDYFIAPTKMVYIKGLRSRYRDGDVISSVNAPSPSLAAAPPAPAPPAPAAASSSSGVPAAEPPAKRKRTGAFAGFPMAM